MNGEKIKGESKISMVPVFQISVNKTQPRKAFSRDDIRYLARSIELNGILQPLIVRDISPFEYELISGERRLRAAVMVGYSFVPCIVVHCNQHQSAVYSLIENIQREDLSYFEQASAINTLIQQYGFSTERIASQIGRNESSVKRKLKLLSFTDAEKRLLIENELCERYAVMLLRINDADVRIKIINTIINNELGLIAAEDLIESIVAPPSEKKKGSKERIIIKDIRFFYNTIEKAVATMKHSGISTTQDKTETDSYVEYKIRIYK